MLIGRLVEGAELMLPFFGAALLLVLAAAAVRWWLRRWAERRWMRRMQRDADAVLETVRKVRAAEAVARSAEEASRE